MKLRHSLNLHFTTEVDDENVLGGNDREIAYTGTAIEIQKHLHEVVSNAVIKIGGKDIKMDQGFQPR